MKKFLVVLVVLTVMITGVFAGTPELIDSDEITIYGIIETGKPLLKATSTVTEGEPLDLTAAAIGPDGAGVPVGYWRLYAPSQVPGSSFLISYTPIAFTSTSAPGVSYTFTIIDTSGDVDGYTPEEDGSGGAVLFEEGVSSLDFTRNLAIKLTEGVAEDAAPGFFEGSIKINLTTDN